MAPRVAVRVSLAGHVQGVGFRYATRQAANRIGVFGWVRNREDGSVEAWLEGGADQIAEMKTFLGKGPPGARVDSLRCEEEASPQGFTEFEIRRH